ncbi:MAG TPA: aromatic amino acid transport family protein [Gammaproteobacteria bacterium]|jgi:tyrosine-specific transport protein|nr:aromatic amino acid transport family protein [Gammaproteobacteria bacterium]
MNSKLFGGILLVIGTTIGAGILALPVATAQLGFAGSVLLLIGCWALMTACSYLFLEVNLWLPANSNLISMAGATLGKPGQMISWVFYLLLLYSIISAYIAGGGDLFHYLMVTHGMSISTGAASILFTSLLGVVVYGGIKVVDYANRFLMFGKMGSFVLLVLMLFPFVFAGNLSGGEFKHIASPTSIMVTAVAFGSAMIIPSLRSYFGEDVKSLRKAIFIGGFVSLLCYIAWDMAIMGIVPLDGSPGLKEMLHSANSNSALVSALTVLLQKPVVTLFAKFFTSICMATSFLSIGLCLSDFLSDGLKVKKQGLGKPFIFALTFLPPVTVVLFYPDAFIRGLNYAGISIVLLLVLFPPLMVWRGRYHRQELAQQGAHQIRGGKLMLAVLVVLASLMMGMGVESAL